MGMQQRVGADMRLRQCFDLDLTTASQQRIVSANVEINLVAVGARDSPFHKNGLAARHYLRILRPSSFSFSLRIEPRLTSSFCIGDPITISSANMTMINSPSQSIPATAMRTISGVHS